MKNGREEVKKFTVLSFGFISMFCNSGAIIVYQNFWSFKWSYLGEGWRYHPFVFEVSFVMNFRIIYSISSIYILRNLRIGEI